MIELPPELVEELKEKFIGHANTKELQFEMCSYIIDWHLKHHRLSDLTPSYPKVQEYVTAVCELPDNTGHWSMGASVTDENIQN